MELFANIFDALSAVLFMYFVLGKRKKYMFTIGASVVAFIFLMLKTDRFSSVIVQTVVTTTILVLYALSCLSGKLLTQVVIAVVYEMILNITNTLVTFAFAVITNFRFQEFIVSSGTFRNVAIISNKLLMLLCFVLAVDIIRQHKMRPMDWIVPLLLMLVDIIVGDVIAQMLLDGGADVSLMAKHQLSIIFIGTIVMSAIMFAVSVRLGKKHLLEIENLELSGRIERQLLTIESAEKLYEDTSILRHDLKHYLTATLGMLELQDSNGAREYLKGVLKEEVDSTRFFNTNSSVINAVLNSRHTACVNKKIKMDSSINGIIPTNIEKELSVLLSNLLDNAVTAAEKSDDRLIELTLNNEAGMYHITVTNSINASVLASNPELKTTKANQEKHGIGLRSVRKIIDGLDGFYQTREAQQRFIFEIYIPINEKCI